MSVSPDNKTPSMKSFDYFSEAAVVAPQAALKADVPGAMEEQIRVWAQARRRDAVSLVLGFVAVAALAWTLGAFRDTMAFAFFGPAEPRLVGEVTRFEPSELEHNSYVTLDGVTEHRGLSQRLVRGLSLARREYWYFRLAGSRGLFIEVEPDPDRYSPVTRVEVTGRVVDPARHSLYRAMVRDYAERFQASLRPESRIVQVGVRPGEGRWPYVLLLLLLLALLANNIRILARYLRGRRGLLRSAVGSS